MSPREHFVDNADARLRVMSLGSGPLVLMCHGFPGLWYSWRHQLKAIADVGYQAVAMDMRGYGRSTRPRGVEDYGFDRQSADVLAVLDYFSADEAVMFGHDFGANLAWHMGVHHRGRIRAIAPLCSPYDMELAGGCDVPPSQLYAAIAENHFFHMHYYQQAHKPEAATHGREREFLQKLFWALSARGELLNWENFPSEGSQYIDVLAPPGSDLPWPWLSVEDMDYYLGEYLSAGPDKAFAGGINAYRVMDYNWRVFRDSSHADVELPVFFSIGAEDPVYKLSTPETFERMRERVKDLRGFAIIPGSGHFVQQEAPERLNSLLLDFLAGL